MKSRSKVWRRLAAVLMGGMLVGTKACADSPWSPRVLLSKGDDAVLTAPEAWFSHEVRRIKVAGTEFAAKPSTHDHGGRTVEAELNDLRMALRKLKMPKAEIERIVAAHAVERGKRAGRTNEAKAIAELPAEFGHYFRGSIALRRGDGASAIREWEELLKLPAAQRQFKSVWAAYMLGRTLHENEPDRAIQHYQQTRRLAAAGFADSTGLAAASIGWEAQAHLLEGRLAKAMELYLEQATTGADSAITSLRTPAEDALSQSVLMEELAANSRARRVVTAYVNAENVDPANVAHWLELMEKQEKLEPEEAETLALAAYRAGEYGAAQRWIKRAQSTPVTLWLQAKIHVQAGKVNPAILALGKAISALPPESSDETNKAPREALVENIFVYGRRFRQLTPRQHMMGEMGMLRLARSEYAEALDCFFRGGFWVDAAYVAERVLTVEELRSYVDKTWPEVDLSKTGPVTDNSEIGRSHIRHLLGRRLVREMLPARSYFPEELRANYDELMAALKRGETESLAEEERAAGWWEGARLIRANGMELIGTELGPDWRSGWPYDSLTLSTRETNENAKVLAASADELRRARRHKADPEERYHYRYQAAFIALQAAGLLPDNSEQKARILCTAGSWIKYLHPATADIFYKHLVRRCGKTALGAAADVRRWFPLLDENGEMPVMSQVLPDVQQVENFIEEPPTVIIVD